MRAPRIARPGRPWRGQGAYVLAPGARAPRRWPRSEGMLVQRAPCALASGPRNRRDKGSGRRRPPGKAGDGPRAGGGARAARGHAVSAERLQVGQPAQVSHVRCRQGPGAGTRAAGGPGGARAKPCPCSAPCVCATPWGRGPRRPGAAARAAARRRPIARRRGGGLGPGAARAARAGTVLCSPGGPRVESQSQNCARGAPRGQSAAGHRQPLPSRFGSRRIGSERERGSRSKAGRARPRGGRARPATVLSAVPGSSGSTALGAGRAASGPARGVCSVCGGGFSSVLFGPRRVCKDMQRWSAGPARGRAGRRAPHGARPRRPGRRPANRTGTRPRGRLGRAGRAGAPVKDQVRAQSTSSTRKVCRQAVALLTLDAHAQRAEPKARGAARRRVEREGRRRRAPSQRRPTRLGLAAGSLAI